MSFTVYMLIALVFWPTFSLYTSLNQAKLMGYIFCTMAGGLCASVWPLTLPGLLMAGGVKYLHQRLERRKEEMEIRRQTGKGIRV